MSDDPSDADGPATAPEWPYIERAPRTPAGLAVISVASVGVGLIYAFIAASFWPMDALTSTPGRVVGGLLMAAIVIGFDLRPKVRVSPDLLVAENHRLPLDDIQEVRPQPRRVMRAEGDTTVDLQARTLLAREGVRVIACNREGLPYRLWIASADPPRLTERIEAAREAARSRVAPPESPSRQGVPSYAGRRGALWSIAGPFLVLFAGVIPWLALRDLGIGVQVSVTILAIALVAVPAAAPVRIDRSELRSARVRVRPDEVVTARILPKGHGVTHLLQMPKRNRSVTVWGPAVSIVCVTEPRGETAEERLRATKVLAIPRQVDLSAILPPDVVDRRLPPATGPVPGIYDVGYPKDAD